jgi:hypothetical protein
MTRIKVAGRLEGAYPAHPNQPMFFDGNKIPKMMANSLGWGGAANASAHVYARPAPNLMSCMRRAAEVLHLLLFRLDLVILRR